MSVLKFRAWFNGDIENNNPIKFIQKWNKFEHVYQFVTEVDPHDGPFYDFATPFSDDDWIVEQCTGFEDKNKVEIYEGDILDSNYAGVRYQRAKSQQIRVVTRLKNTKTLALCTASECRWQARGYGLSNTTHKRFEVIGNIHENPELLS